MACNMPRQMLLPVVCGRCYSHFVYICLGWCYCLWLWQMLLPILPQVLLMADVIAKMSHLYCNHQCWYVVRQMLLPSGRWNGHFDYNAGWCYCQVADGIATTGLECWQMLLPCGRWNSHWVLLFKFKFWGVKQNLIPYVRQMVFTYVSI